MSDRTIVNKIARYVSAVGNAPIVAATVFTVLIAFTRSPLYQLVIAIVFATLVPLGLLFYLTRKRIIPDLYASDRDSRAIAFVGVLISYFLGGVALGLTRAIPIVTGLMLCYFVNGFIAMLISLKWKISVHAWGITGPLTSLIFQFGLLLSPIWLLVVPVGWARLEMKAHSLSQILAGAMIAIPLTWFQLVVYTAIL
ncbi:hypothetical protein E6H23_08895 [Candidatus Bathyarchaeota archaeon]|nr:MAG: hypothetical protein E6H23_08895 [Candidatus Bathyarchaeota archaeon]